MDQFELNLDGLVGPTHNYAGLASGNIASKTHALSPSNPQKAALQGILKMELVHQLGVQQAFLPPHPRPNLNLLFEMGFTGTPTQQIEKAYKSAPELLAACYSASSMWCANAATVSSSAESLDQRIHFTAANLISNLHRHQEASFSSHLLKTFFSDESYFVHHPILPRSMITSDEGAANHNRLWDSHGHSIALFVYGTVGLSNGEPISAPRKYPARQTIEASLAIARSHQLHPEKVVLARQNPKVIDEGVFHHDVIGVSNGSVLLIHEEAFVDQKKVLEELQAKANFAITLIEINKSELTVPEAVSTYLFNSQLLSLPGNEKTTMALIAPSECQDHPKTKHLIDKIIACPLNPINSVYYLDLKQSMRNGGGPACLRLRIPMTSAQLQAMNANILIHDLALEKLKVWVKSHYRTSLKADDLRDPMLINESFTALDELTRLFDLGSIYPFQREIN